MLVHISSHSSDSMRIYMTFFTYRQLCVTLDHYSCDDLLMQSIVRRIINIIVHLMIVFIICVLDCIRNCNSDCFNEHPQADPSSFVVMSKVVKNGVRASTIQITLNSSQQFPQIEADTYLFCSMHISNFYDYCLCVCLEPGDSTWFFCSSTTLLIYDLLNPMNCFNIS